MKRITSFVLCLLVVSIAQSDDWPQWMGPNRVGIWSEKDILEKFPKDGPKVLWRTPIGSGYAGPAVVGNRVFVMDYLTKDDIKKDNFGRKEYTGKERVLCLSVDKGEILWKHEYDRNYKISYPTGPRCTPTVHEGKVYSLGAEGDLFCLDAEKGSILWSKNFGQDYKAKTPLWGFASHPLIDGKKLICIVGGEGSTVVAFDKDSGKEIWKALSAKQQGYSSPTIIESGGKRQLLIWDGEALNSLDPENGKKLCPSLELPTYQSMSIMTPRKDGDYLFVGAVYGTSVGLKLDKEKPGISEVWRGPKNMKGKGLYPCNMTPWVEDGIIYGCDQPGQFRAVKLDSGEQLWESWLPVTGKEESRPVFCGTAFLVKNDKRFFLFNELGELIIANITPKGYEEISRAKLMEPTSAAFGRDVVWSHPAYANKCCFARNDKEIICVSLAK